jgi:hypothetical protein
MTGMSEGVLLLVLSREAEGRLMEASTTQFLFVEDPNTVLDRTHIFPFTLACIA